MYKLATFGVIRLSDGANIIGPDTTNQSWKEYTDWVALGNSPLPIETFEEKKNRKIDEFNMICEDEITGGYTSSALGEPHVYDSDIEDQINMIGSTLFGLGANMPIPYKCLKVGEIIKAWVVHTPEQIQQVYNDGVFYKLTIMQKFTTLKHQLLASITEEQLDLIEW